MISVLFRKTHYDLVYNNEYFHLYNNYLCTYASLNENLLILKDEIPFLDVHEDNSAMLSLYSSNEINKNFKDFNSNINSNNSNNNDHNNNYNINHGINDKTNTNNLIIDPNLKGENTWICITCENPNKISQNIFNLCFKCLNTELQSIFTKVYLQLLTNAISLHKQSRENEITSYFEKCKIIINHI